MLLIQLDTKVLLVPDAGAQHGPPAPPSSFSCIPLCIVPKFSDKLKISAIDVCLRMSLVVYIVIARFKLGGN